MKQSAALDALTGLGHATRLEIFRWLVQIGREGASAGKIAERFDLPATTLSFHLAHLERCGLLHSQRNGRMIIYSTNYEAMDELVAYLTENCCVGVDTAACSPAAQRNPAGKSLKSPRKPTR